MRKARRIGLVLGAIVLGVVSHPVAMAQEQRTANWMIKYDLDSTNLTYCVVTGTQNDPFGPPMQVDTRIKTTGSSATVDEAVASTGPFAALSAGDIIFVKNDDNTTTIRVITAKSSAAEVTVDAAVDWSSGVAFSWKKTTCGTGATNGWINVAAYEDKTMILQYDQGDLSGGLDARWECRAAGINAQPVQVYPSSGLQNFPTANIGIGARTAVVDFSPWSDCRLGVAAHTSDPSDSSTNLEQITAILVVTPRR